MNTTPKRRGRPPLEKKPTKPKIKKDYKFYISYRHKEGDVLPMGWYYFDTAYKTENKAKSYVKKIEKQSILNKANLFNVTQKQVESLEIKIVKLSNLK